MDPQRLERVRKRREEDDEEFMFLLLPILRLRLMGRRGQMERRQRHSSVLYGKNRVEQILEGHVKNCRVAYRMEAHIFKSLASYLRRERLLKDKRIKVEEKLVFFSTCCHIMHHLKICNWSSSTATGPSTSASENSSKSSLS
jgi:hypothetical protein